MATKNLIYHAYDASSLPVDGVDVTLECFDSAGGRSVFYGTLHLLAPYTGTTAADGSVTINNVPANADTDDPYSYYLFTARGVLELTGGGGQGYFDQFYVVVPHSGSSPIDISTIKRDAPPTPGGSTPLHDQTSHQGDIWPDATDQVAGASTLQIAQQASGGVSAPPAGSRKLFVRDSDTHLALMKSDSSVIDLEAGGSGLTGGTPALTLSTSNSAGVAATGVRTDATIAAFDATTPANIGTAATGTAGTAARRDHVHATGAGTPATVGTANAIGTGPAAAMTDHVHAHEAAHVAHDTIWDAAGDLAVGTGADTAAKLAITVPGANILNVLGVVNGETTWSVKSVHDGTAPAAIGTAAAGTALTASHRDHVHATGAGTPSTQAFGDAAATGTGPAASMTDHKHAMPNSTAGPDADITIDAAGAAGTASTAARSAHGHKLATYGSAAAATAAAGAAGTSTTAPSRGDHVHAIGSGSVGNGLTLTSGVLSAIAATAQTADVTASETTTSATYTNLTTDGPSVTATVGPSGVALVILSATISANSNGNVQYASLSVDGGTPVDADAALTANAQSQKPCRQILVTGLSPGSHTFKIQYKAGAGTGTFSNRRIVVVPL